MCIHIYRLCELVKTSSERKPSGETVGKGGMEEVRGKEGVTGDVAATGGSVK